MAASAKAVVGIAPPKGAKKAKKSPVPETQRAMQVDEQATVGAPDECVIGHTMQPAHNHMDTRPPAYH